MVADRHDDTVAFASGVAASSITARAEFDRESNLLEEVLTEARSSDLRVIYFSGGGALYGRWHDPASESGPVNPSSAYGRHQLECERTIQAARVRFLIVRLPNVVGSTANSRQLVPALVRQALRGKVRVQRGAERDLIDASDVGPVISLVLDASTGDDVVNVASGHSVPALEIVREICRVLTIEPEIQLEPGGESQRFSTEHLKDLVGFNPFPDAHAYRSILQTYVPTLARHAIDSDIATDDLGAP